MPLDVKPLTKAARESAIDLARTHKGIGSALDGGGRVVAVAPNLHDQRNPDPGARVVVGVYDYEKNTTLVALVDPKKKSVVGVEEIAAQFQLSDEEAKTAEALAAKDKRVRKPSVACAEPAHAPPFSCCVDRSTGHAILVRAADDVGAPLTRSSISPPGRSPTRPRS